MDNELPDGKTPDCGTDCNHIIILPGRITKSHCSSCKAELTYLIEAIKSGTTSWPAFCPECAIPFRKGEVTERVWKCPKCFSIIVDPKKQKYCLQCGLEFLCPQELLMEGERCRQGTKKTRPLRL